MWCNLSRGKIMRYSNIDKEKANGVVYTPNTMANGQI